MARHRSAGAGFAFLWAADRPALEAAAEKLGLGHKRWLLVALRMNTRRPLFILLLLLCHCRVTSSFGLLQLPALSSCQSPLQYLCHQSTVQPPLSSSQSAQTLPLATNIYQVQQIFANFSSSRIFFFKHHLFNPVRGCPEFFQKLILSEVKLRDKNRDHGGQDDHDYHDDEKIMIL